MNILTAPSTLLFILLGSMLIITMMRVALPMGQKIEGKALRHISLTYRERLLLHRTNLYAIGVVLLLTTLSGYLSLLAELAVVAAAFVIIMLPTRYTLTSEGVALNNVVFRHWSEFSGVEVRRGRIVLLGRDGNGPFRMSLLAANRPDVLHNLEKLVGAPARAMNRAERRVWKRTASV